MATEEINADDYGVLTRILSSYYPTLEDPEDRSDELLDKYHRYGERDIEFDGLAEQAKRASQRPTEASEVLKQELGLELTRVQTSQYMMDLYKNLMNVDELKQEAETSTEALTDYWLRRPIPVQLPFSIPKFGNTPPLWLVGVISLVVAGFGWLGVVYVKVPVVNQIFLGILIVGALALLLSAIAMYGLRDEVVNADKYRKRDEELNLYREGKRSKRPARWRIGNWGR